MEECFAEWIRFVEAENDDPYQFAGVRLSDLPLLEECFEIDIYVYTLSETVECDRSVDNDVPDSLHAKVLVRSIGRFKERKMFLNLLGKHFSLIKNVNKYAKCWRCGACNRLVRRHNNYRLHLQKCTGKTTKVYKGGGFGLPLTIFDKLRDEAVEIDNDLRYYPFRVVYDFEARFEAGDESKDTAKMKFEKRLVPVSFSLSSNVPGFEDARCTIKACPVELICTFIEQLNDISRGAYEAVSLTYQDITNHIESQAFDAIEAKETVRTLKGAKSPKEDIEAAVAKAWFLDKWVHLKREWERWLRQLPVIGFNSANFDINLIREYLIPHCIQNEIELLPPIVRNSSYLMLATKDLLFLDITNYLAAGVSYSAWLKGFGVEETKGAFPYEWLTDFQKLYNRELPPQPDFYSTLKQEGISDEDYILLQNIWKSENFTTMFDFLTWYNNKDVRPFLVGINKMVCIMKEMGIDMFKSGNISLPGLAMTHIFQIFLRTWFSKLSGLLRRSTGTKYKKT